MSLFLVTARLHFSPSALFSLHIVLTYILPPTTLPTLPPSLDGALLVYDITDEASFKRVQEWVKELKKMLGEDIVIAIAGNKADMEKGRHVDKDEALRFTAAIGGSHHLTSAKSGAGVADAFTELLKRIVAKKKKEASTKPPSGPLRNALIIVDDDEAPATKKGCC